ncbi:toll/interleukin-1 receptor domain-containing protein [Paucibacter sediminis]|uniref:Toll/interleukin-1 receptor domain-containing protein n=1 Tax=Paucibacter sediminis TaxID=3019553 RepID=A0AA95SPP1_9BURK|nr:toll/interleukin-1 receptor domain-containing protein [Paucibacter sp. S2-9]WIT12560.1 toll/interleukin-1 receptor domain-containing protein [Paucibacter sp. S2-9]
MTEQDWKRLLRQVREGLVVPVVGSELLRDEAGHNLLSLAAQRLLQGYGLQAAEPELAPFLALPRAVAQVHLMCQTDLQDLYAEAHDALEAVLSEHQYQAPVALQQLAEISDFKLWVSATPDDLLARCLRQRGALTEVVHAPKLPTNEWQDLPPDWSSRGGAHLLYLFGRARAAPLFAAHEEDVLEYAHNILTRGSQVPTAFLGALQERSLLLLGCSFPDWLGRFLLRVTNKSRLSEKTKREWLVDRPDAEQGGLTHFLRAYSRDTELFSDLEPSAFVAELHRRWKLEQAAPKPASLPNPAEPPPAAVFFVSYSRGSDQAAAQALVQTLRDLGASGPADVWFDISTLEPGDNFAQRIFDGIAGCRYFVPLISRGAEARDEAFVFREWRRANERAEGMNRDFILPLIVDAEFQPERLSHVISRGWREHLDLGHAPGGLPNERTRQRLERLLRESRRPLV